MGVHITNGVYVIVPAYNEDKRVGSLVNKVFHEGFYNIIVVDDGSTDETREVALRSGATVLRHQINLGAGAATQTGISYAEKLGAEYIVTIDADLQHLPEDIHDLLQPLLDGSADLVVGSRFMKKTNVIPSTRRVYNRIANWVTYIFTGVSMTDSQSGMKAMSADFARAQEMNSNGFEFCVEIIRNAADLRARIKEVPISVRYSRETMQKGQSLLNGVRMIGRILRFNLTK